MVDYEQQSTLRPRKEVGVRWLCMVCERRLYGLREEMMMTSFSSDYGVRSRSLVDVYSSIASGESAQNLSCDFFFFSLNKV